MHKVQLISLGCSKNRVDSEHLLRQIESAGWTVSPEDADLVSAGVDTVLINTCGFISDAKEESVNTIFDIVRAKQEGLINRLFVFGCLSQRYARQMPELIPEVDAFFGTDDQESILKALGITRQPHLLQRRHLTTPSHYAYLKIAEGCDRQCSYCAIPLIRGPHVSVPEELLLDEAKSLAAAGVRELILVAQDTTYYGLDLYGRRTLCRLLEKLSAIDGIEWIRIHYSYPDGFPEDVLRLMAANPKICKYIDIPLQHSADNVLRAMRRSIDSRQTLELVEKMRRLVPGVVLRTTLMVGHPGEGEAEFEHLENFVRECRFERLGVFEYSEEEGTWGSENLRDEIPDEVKRERFDRLMELQRGISGEYNASRIGSEERVLVDSFADGVFVARSQGESPEVDGEILIGADGRLPEEVVGEFFNVKIKAADEYDLMACF